MTLRHRDAGRLVLAVSLHTKEELRSEEARQLADTAEVLPYRPVGSWDDLVGTWKDLTGTWDDIDRQNAILNKLRELAKAGASIRDLGALIDALFGDVDIFVTSDTDLVGSGPVARIAATFPGLRIMSPEQLAEELKDP